MPTKFSCTLSFHTLEPCARRGEPVSVGLPWPRGAISDEKYFQLIGPDGSPQLLQSKVLDRWPDGSVRWFNETTDSVVQRALLTTDGSESIPGFE